MSSIALLLAFAAPTQADVTKLNGPLARAQGDFADLGGPGGDVLGYQLSPDGGWAVFQADVDVDTRYDVFGVPLDGSAALRKLCSGSGEPIAYAIDPTSTRVVLVDDVLATGARELFGVAIDGSSPPVRLSAPLAPGQSIHSFRVGAGRVVFRDDAATAGVDELWSAPLDGGAAPIRLHPALAAGRSVIDYHLTPDGTVAVYVADQGTNDVFELFRVPVDGSAPPTRISPALVANGDVVGFGLSFSPDGGRVLFNADALLDGRNDLYSAPTDASAPAALLSAALPAFGDTSPLAAVAPSGDRVAYVADGVVDERYELFVVPIDGGAAPLRVNGTLADGGDVAVFSFSADGQRLAYVADQETDGKHEIFGVPSDGSAPAVKLNGALPDFGEVFAQGNATTPGFFFDAGRVIYLADATIDGLRELFSAPPDGSSAALRLHAPVGAGQTVFEAVPAANGRVAFLANLAHAAKNELWIVPADGSAAPRRLNGPLEAHADCASFELDPSGSRAAYLADATVDEVASLWSVPLDASSPAVELTAGMPEPPIVGDVAVASFAPGGRVLYTADVESDQELGLYAVDVRTLERAQLSPRAIPDVSVSKYHLAPGARVVFDWLSSPPGYSAWSSTLYAAPLDGGEPAAPIESVSNTNMELEVASNGLVLFTRRWVGFHASGGSDLHVVPSDGSVPALLLTDGMFEEEVFAVTPTPLGERAVYRHFALVPPFGSSLRSVKTDGSAPALVLASAGEVSSLRVRPQGDRALFVADVAAAGRFELWSVPLDASAAAIRLNAPLAAAGDVTADFRLTSDGSRAVYRADQDFDEVFELWSVPATGGASVRLSGAMVLGGDVAALPNAESQLELSLDGARVVYVADQQRDEAYELFSAPVDGSQPAVRLNAPLAPGGDVRPNGARFTPDGTRVVFVADQDTNDVVELYVVPADGGLAPLQLNPPMVAGGDVLTGTGGARDSFAVTDGYVVYLADQDVDERVELWRAPLDGSGLAVKMSAPLVAAGDVRSFVVSTDRRVLYLADQEQDEVIELYLATLPHELGTRVPLLRPGARPGTVIPFGG